MRKSTAILSAAVVALTTAISMSPAHAAALQVTASITTSSAQSGYGPIVTGQLTPAFSGRTVYIQRYYSDSWHTVATTTTNGSGAYYEHVTFDELNYKVGALKFRAKVLGYSGYTADASPSITKTIYRWQSLAYMDATYGDSRRYVDGNDEFTVDGSSADDSWQIKNPLEDEVSTRYTKWNLQEKCIRLQGFAGIDDYDSAEAAQGRLLVGIDGTAYDGALTLDKYEYAWIDKDLRKTNYLTLKGYKLNSYATTIGMGEPEVNCSKNLPQDY